LYDVFSGFCRAEQILQDEANLLAYSYDNSRISFKPQIVLLPETEEEIVKTVLACKNSKIPLTVRGRGTATTGAALPTEGGVVLSTERFNKVIDFCPASKYIVVEPGITNQHLQDICKEQNLFWGPNPSSMGFSSVGGNLACNSAGSRSLKYGAARDKTLAVRFVTGEGKIITSGKAVSKQAVGFDFARLIIGSEGMLGIILNATLKLDFLPEQTTTIRVIYKDTRSAGDAIISIMQQTLIPTSLEFLDRHSVALIRDDVDLPPGDEILMLIIEVDGDAAAIKHAIDQVNKAARNSGLLEFMVADSKPAKQKIWQARKALSPKLRKIAPKKINEDVVVPIDKLATLLVGLDRLRAKYAINIVNFGHAGNGNIHVNLLVDPDDEKRVARAAKCLDEIFKLVLKLGGSISGEHGIGLVKRDFLPLELGDNNLELMRKVKSQFDPDNILNPGKLLA